jgi:hypothetical protein
MGTISKFASEDSLVRFPGLRRGSSLEFQRAGVSVGQKLIHFVSECPTPIPAAKRNVRHERGKTTLISLLTDRDALEAVAADTINIAPESGSRHLCARRRPTSRTRACYVAVPVRSLHLTGTAGEPFVCAAAGTAGSKSRVGVDKWEHVDGDADRGVGWQRVLRASLPEPHRDEATLKQSNVESVPKNKAPQTSRL